MRAWKFRLPSPRITLVPAAILFGVWSNNLQTPGSGTHNGRRVVDQWLIRRSAMFRPIERNTCRGALVSIAATVMHAFMYWCAITARTCFYCCFLCNPPTDRIEPSDHPKNAAICIPKKSSADIIFFTRQRRYNSICETRVLARISKRRVLLASLIDRCEHRCTVTIFYLDLERTL